MNEIAKIRYAEPHQQRPVWVVSVGFSRDFQTREKEYLERLFGKEVVEKIDSLFADHSTRHENYHVVIVNDSELKSLENLAGE